MANFNAYKFERLKVIDFLTCIWPPLTFIYNGRQVDHDIQSIFYSLLLFSILHIIIVYAHCRRLVEYSTNRRRPLLGQQPVMTCISPKLVRTARPHVRWFIVYNMCIVYILYTKHIDLNSFADYIYIQLTI